MSVLPRIGPIVEGSDEAKGLSKEQARSGLRRMQLATGFVLLASAVIGVYLLATDASLWLLAVSHAVGLVMIVVLDTVLGFMSLSTSKKAYLPSIAAAFLGFILQAGDVLTAPQYNMTVAHFASYLFGLWAFDLLLILQLSVIFIGLVGRPYAQHLARRKTRRGRELNYSRRSFMKTIAGFTGLIGLGVLVGSVKLPAPPPPNAQSTTTQSVAVKGAVANTKDLQIGNPVYFEYPSGYPNILMKNQDGTLTALSLYCTHVCCECSYVASSNVIYCPCHGSVFDAMGQVVRGPANVPLPTIQLNVDSSGNIFPIGVSNPGPCQA